MMSENWNTGMLKRTCEPHNKLVTVYVNIRIISLSLLFGESVSLPASLAESVTKFSVIFNMFGQSTSFVFRDGSSDLLGILSFANVDKKYWK
jgi:hypothetical protein